MGNCSLSDRRSAVHQTAIAGAGSKDPPGVARRRVQQQRQEQPLRRAQQEQPEQQEQRHWFSGGVVAVHIFCATGTARRPRLPGRGEKNGGACSWPIFDRSFIADSYANRAGKGTHRALGRCQALARKHRYFLQMDVAQFFPAIDHRLLHDILARKIADSDVMWLIDRILESGRGLLTQAYDMRWFEGDELFAICRPRGLPIGNLTSQLWANCYLNPFDHFVKRSLRCRAYLRYVDDMLLFADDKGQLWRWKAAVEGKLAQLRLTLHPAAHPRPVAEGIPFLGFVTYPEKRCLKRRKGIHYRRRLKRLIQDYTAGRISLADLSASVLGWVNHVRYGNTVGLRNSVLNFSIPFRKGAP
jgi:hypothetical protein